MFCSLADFTRQIERLPPRDILRALNLVFTSIDELCKKYDVQKIETIGEVYVCAVGLDPSEIC